MFTEMGLTDDPTSSRFQHHVSFDNFAGGEPTAKNSISFTLNVTHRGYQRKRRSRTFMVGVDENDYSDIALSWMLEELVDDGDEIICLRVVDKDAKVVSDRNVDRKTYQEEAKKLMERIQTRNDEHRAISIVLEYAVGKVHAVFQKMIQLYEPAMLVVGTRGRSLGGFQGLMNMSNSFSKWCLQYSPIPVVVVRPTEKRAKKKKKRDADPSRQDYARILRESGLEKHEIEGGSKNSIFEETNAPDVEAHAVAAALGLPAAFDPTLKPYFAEGNGRSLRKVESATSDGTSVSTNVSTSMCTSASKSSVSPDSRPTSPTTVMKSPHARRESAESRDSNSLSGEEESSEDEGEFEIVSGHDLLGSTDERPEIERKMKLHEMEVGEAAALAAGRKASVGSADSSGSARSLPLEDEDDEQQKTLG
ncbi:universal stress protein [Diplocarpon rosae]|nr:universal stress protein [Diplocarpon rosae]